MAPKELSKEALNEIISETSDSLGTEMKQVMLNDKLHTPLADLAKAVTAQMVERYHVRTREPVLAAMYGLAANPKAYAAYERLSQTARDAVDEVHRFKGMIVQKQVTECLDNLQLLSGVREMSGPGRVALLTWLVVMAVKFTGKKPDKMTIDST